MDFAKMALFKSYVVFYLTISVAIYDVLSLYYSYPHDTETRTVVSSVSGRSILTGRC